MPDDLFVLYVKVNSRHAVLRWRGWVSAGLPGGGCGVAERDADEQKFRLSHRRRHPVFSPARSVDGKMDKPYRAQPRTASPRGLAGGSIRPRIASPDQVVHVPRLAGEGDRVSGALERLRAGHDTEPAFPGPGLDQET